ncbi:MAG: orotidine 5'-phosphate decarboxylase / HUMPS family protein [Deltaproteobacteria bacterium]|nr:orotidine 5'-phosphate decarboxylase [Deltaproteobacteria bacterium]MDW8003002.1 orotidine 5'-phosphate decarboxylase / HUMPS family protein [Deltaproteobacteria bacterium]
MTQLIVAVDGFSFEEAKEKGIFDKLKAAKEKGMIWGIKINDMLFSASTPYIIKTLKEIYSLSVFADTKLHDIPNTIENCLNRLVEAGADIVSVHCSANFRPRKEQLLEHIAGFTVLTSFTDLQVKWIYERNTEEMIRNFADIALMNGYAYVVLSAKGLSVIKDYPLKKICTGIRPHWFPHRKDQIAVSSIKEAVRAEADYIVMGRPITEWPDIFEAIERVYSEIV